MASTGLMDYGIAINFFGNYRTEGTAIQQTAEKINSTLLSLQHIVLGGSIAYAFKSMGSALLHTATELEQVYAKLMTVFADRERVREHFVHAREFVAQNPYMNLEQVHEGTAQLAIQGLAKTADQANKNLKYLGDFAAGKGLQFHEGIQAVTNAINGNWQMLSFRGIRQDNLRTVAGNAHGTFTDDDGKIKEKSAVMLQLASTLEKAKKGTNEYAEALIKFVGVMEAGGMTNASKTITGALGAMHNMFTIFKLEIVGATQELGTFANMVGTTMSKVAGVFQSKIHQIEGIGRGLGHFFSDIFSMFTGDIEKGTSVIAGYIDKLDKFFEHYEQNVAPIILFLFLVKLQVESFLKGFYDGFSSVFGWFVKAGIGVYTTLGKIVMWLGLGKDPADALGKSLGVIMGLLFGIKAFKFIVSPLVSLIGDAQLLIGKLTLVRDLIAGGKEFTIAEGVITNWFRFVSWVSKLRTGLMLATESAWAFIAPLLANPITWVVIAVIALVAWLGYLITHWEEVGKSMQGVSDWLLLITAYFLPIVGIPLIMAKYWDDFKEIFFNIWRGIRGYIMGSWLYIRREFINPVKKAMTELWTGIKQKAQEFVDMIMTKFPWLRTLFDGIKSVWDAIKSGIAWVIDKLENSTIIKTALGWAKNISGMFGDAGDDFYQKQLREDAKQANKDNPNKGVMDDERMKYYSPPAPVAQTTDQSTTNHYSIPNAVIKVEAPANGKPEDFAKNLGMQFSTMAGKKGK